MKIVVNKSDITSLSGELSLSSSIEQLGDSLSWSMAINDNKFLKTNDINVGDIVRLINNEGYEVYRGVIVAIDNDTKSKSFTSYDFAFYLNKSKAVIQFNKLRADKAIIQLLNKYSVPIETVASMNTIISGIYYDKEVSEIIKDILDKVNKASKKKFLMSMQKGKFCILENHIKPITIKIKQANNLAPVDIRKIIANAKKTESIENMKNSITIYSEDNKRIKKQYTVSDKGSISRYGLLSDTESVSDKEVAKIKNIADSKFKELNKIEKTLSLDVIGSFDLLAGRVMEFNIKDLNIKGVYMIKSASHKITNVLHTVSLELEAI